MLSLLAHQYTAFCHQGSTYRNNCHYFQEQSTITNLALKYHVKNILKKLSLNNCFAELSTRQGWKTHVMERNYNNYNGSNEMADVPDHWQEQTVKKTEIVHWRGMSFIYYKLHCCHYVWQWPYETANSPEADSICSWILLISAGSRGNILRKGYHPWNINEDFFFVHTNAYCVTSKIVIFPVFLQLDKKQETRETQTEKVTNKSAELTK